MPNNVIELSNPLYVTVIKGTDTYYGGSQMWFPRIHWYSKDYIIHKYGCGTIATADLFLYLALQDDANQTLETFLTLQGDNRVSFENYNSYVRLIHEEYTRTRRFLAVLGPKIASAINVYSQNYDLGLEASWKWTLTYYDMYEIIEDMLIQDLPVILSIGPNTPDLWGNKGIPFYERKEIEYSEETFEKDISKEDISKEDISKEGISKEYFSSDDISKDRTNDNTDTPAKIKKPYYYKVIHPCVNGHYVTVTGLIKDDITERIMLRISSWGKQYYINYEEYRDYIESFSGTFTSSIVQIKRTLF